MEDLKKELEGLKSDLIANFETKSKVDIQAAIDAFETKSKGLYEKEVADLKAEFETKSAAMQDHLDKLDVRLQEANAGQKLEVKTFNQNLAETIEANADAIKGFKGGKQEITMEMKAVGDMNIAANFPGATPFIQEVRNDLIVNPYNRVWLADLLPQGSAQSSNSIIYPKENGGEGGAAVWTDRTADKAQMDFDLTSQTAFFKWIAGYVIVDREMLDDIPFLTSYLQTKMLISLKTAENDFILNGTSDTNPVQGLLDVATAYNGYYTATVDRIIDAGWGQIVEDTFQFYNPTTAIVSPRNQVKIGLNKATGSGEYDLPNGSVAFTNGRLEVGGLQVSPSTQMNDDFLVFDRNATLLVNRLAPEIRMFEDATLAKKNRIMFRIEERLTLAIFNNKAIVRGALTPTT